MYIVNGIEKLSKIPTKAVGIIKLRDSKDIDCSPIGVGMEKADGNFYDALKVAPYIGGTGVKWVRVQSGWGRTEISEGVYNFKWLDDIIDAVIEQGATPWVCLCYGSYLYDEDIEKGGRGIGRPPIYTERQRVAWDNYVKATIEHYRGKITYYEIWNEPDGDHCWKRGVNGVEYGQFAYTTAKLIKELDPTAKVIVGSMCNLIRLKRHAKDCGVTFDDKPNMANFYTDFMDQGCAKYSDYVTFHTYMQLPEYNAKQIFDELETTAHKYNDKLGIIQGETGVHSAFATVGALNSAEWTEEIQAKYLMRRLYTDVYNGCFFSSYFSMADMYESMNDGGAKNKAMFGRYGVIGACFDKDDMFTGEYEPKPSYLALKVTSNVFAGGVKKADNFVEFCAHRNAYWGSTDIDENDPMGDMLTMYTFERENGSKVVAYYVASSLLNVVYSGTTALKIKGGMKRPLLVNGINGEIYPVPKSNMTTTEDGDLLIMRAPIYDYPMLLIDGEDTDLI